MANRLRDQCGYQVVKTNAPKPGEDVFKTYTDSLMTAVASGQPTVFDRHYLGERVYGPLLRGRDGLGAQGTALMERLVAAVGATLVICAPPWETLMAGWGSKDDLLKRTDQLRTVNDHYLAEAKRLGLTVYDWTKSLPFDAEPRAPLPTGVTGYRQAEMLWVGERTSKNRLDWDLPFHNLTGCSKYLWDSLQALGLEDNRGAWVNTYDLAKHPRDMTAVVAILPQLRKVVALGTVAAVACARQGVKASQVPHPAFWKRFHTDDHASYQKLLRKALND